MSIGIVRRHRRMARQGRLRARATTLHVRTRTSRWSDTHVVYPRDVSGRQIDRDAWASVISDLITIKAKGNKTAFARLVGVKSAQTVDRWLKGVVSVSEANVREVARACDLNAAELLVRLGYYGADEIGHAGPTPDEDEEAIRRIRESGASEAAKSQLIAMLARMRTEHERQRLQVVQEMLNVAGDSPDKPQR